MRLLNTSTLALEEFYGEIPKYAILSHRWEKQEVSFQAMNAGRAGRAYQLLGYEKINRSCFQAMDDGLRYIWVDTCCIDKTSSAELSEAINSMFWWYRNAEVCYAYLFDVDEDSELDESLWWTRGWTLQELLAPRKVVFYGRAWHFLGTKDSLEDRISDITGIGSLYNFENASVAQRMSWASTRTTTRIEDMAYCLMGLFGVHMSPLYGEGKNAFQRLQLEILSKSDDESIFAWTEDLSESGMLASSPAAFRESGDIVQLGVGGINRVPYYMTNKGLRLKSSGTVVGGSAGKILIPINCKHNFSETNQLAITLRLAHGDQYLRVPHKLSRLSLLFPQSKGLNSSTEPSDTTTRVFYIRQRDSDLLYIADGAPGQYDFVIRNNIAVRSMGAIARWGENSLIEMKGWRRPLPFEAKLLGEGEYDQEAILGVNISTSLPGSWATAMFETRTNLLFGIMFYFDEEYHVGIHVLGFLESTKSQTIEVQSYKPTPENSTKEPWQDSSIISDISNRILVRRGGAESYNKQEQRNFGNSIVDEIREMWQEQGVGGESLTLDMYLMMEDTFRRLLLEKPPRKLLHEHTFTTVSPALTVQARLNEGPHLGKQRFEVLLALRPKVVA